MMNLRPEELITHKIIEEVFDYEKPYYFDRFDDSDNVL